MADSIWDLGNEEAPADSGTANPDSLTHLGKIIANSLGRGFSTSIPYIHDVLSNLATPKGQVGGGMNGEGGSGNPVGVAEALKGRGQETTDVSNKYSKIAGNPQPRNKTEEYASSIAMGVGSSVLPGQGIWSLGKAAVGGVVGGVSAQAAHDVFPNSEWAPVIAGLGGGLVGATGAHMVGRRGSPVTVGSSHPEYAQLVDHVIPQLEGGGTLDNPKTNPDSGAMGPMQVIPETAAKPGYRIKPWDGKSQEDLARVGREKFAAMLHKYNGDTSKALAAYNWGEGHVDAVIEAHGNNWLDHAPPETQRYVNKGMALTYGGSAVHGGSTGGAVGPMSPEDMAVGDLGPESTKAPELVVDNEKPIGSDNVSSLGEFRDTKKVREAIDEHQKVNDLLDNHLEDAHDVQDSINAGKVPLTLNELKDWEQRSADIRDAMPKEHPLRYKAEELANMYSDMVKGYHSDPIAEKAVIDSSHEKMTGPIRENIPANTNEEPNPNVDLSMLTPQAAKRIKDAIDKNPDIANALGLTTDNLKLKSVEGGGGKEPPFGGGGEPPSEPPKGPEGDKYAGSINLNAMLISQEAKEHIRLMAAPMNADIETFNETRQKANDLIDKHGVEGILNIDKVAPEDLAHYSTAIRAIHAAAQDHMIRANEQFLNPESNSDINHAKWVHAKDVLAQAFDRNQKVAKGLGRGLGAMRIEVGGTEGKLGEAVSDLMKTRASDEEIARMIQEHPELAGKISRDSNTPGFSEVVFTTWYAMLLSGLRTFARNVLSNALMNSWDTFLVHPTAAIIGKLHGGDKVTFTEAGSRMAGLMQGTITGLSHMGEAYRRGSPSDFVERTQSYWKPQNKGIGRVISAPMRALAAQDQFFLDTAQNADYFGMAHRNAFNEGLTGDDYKARVQDLITNPTEAMQKSAIKYAQMMRFQDPMEFKGLEYVTRATKTDPVAIKIMKGFMRLLFPFPRNSDRMFFGAIRNSPIGMIEPQNIRDFKAGGAKRDVAMARVFVGSMAAAALYQWAVNGGINAGGPSDPGMNARWRQTHMPYSFNFPGGVHVSYQGVADPFSIMIAGIATAVEQANKKGGSLEKKIFRSATNMTGVMMNTTWATGASQFFDALGDKSGKTMESWLGRMASSFTTPALLREINQDYLDPTVRNTKHHPFIDNVKAGLPELSKELPPRRDATGKVIKRENPMYLNVINPAKVQHDKHGSVAAPDSGKDVWSL